MNKITRLVAVLALGAFASLASAAQVQGILIDKMCSTKFMNGKQAEAAQHPKSCAMSDACMRSGFGVLTADGKFLAFDAAGNKKAIAALKATKKTDDLKVTVNGDVKGDSVTVADLKLI
jgi:hypothetical protein